MIHRELNQSDLKNRKDVRDKLFITIDGEDTKDIDDAICLEKLDNGNLILYVSIADVSNDLLSVIHINIYR